MFPTGALGGIGRSSALDQFRNGRLRNNDPVALEYMKRTGRWVNYEKQQGLWGPFAQQEAFLNSLHAKLAAIKLPNIEGSQALQTVTRLLYDISTTTNEITTVNGIRSRVLALLHKFVSEVYYEREFAAQAESTFERYKKDVDALIAVYCGDVLSKIPAVIDRLSEGSEEGISQALSTCRRILEAFADAIYPPTDATVELGGNTLKLEHFSIRLGVA
jgi:hypothetical protein